MSDRARVALSRCATGVDQGGLGSARRSTVGGRDRARRTGPPGDERTRYGANSPGRGVFVGGGDRGSDQYFGARHAGRSALQLVEQSRKGGVGGMAVRSNREA